MVKKHGDNFIKNYEKIRPVLREFFLYGCFNRDDFAIRKICARKYDNERRIICNTLPRDVVEEAVVDKKKYIRLIYDMFHKRGNYLYDTYKIKELDNRSAALYLQIIQCLYRKQGMKRSELCDELPPIADQTTIYRHLKLFQKLGIIIEKRQKNACQYFVPDIFSPLSEQDFNRLYQAVAFFANVLPLSIPGYTLMDVMRLYAEGKGWHSLPTIQTFQFKHLHIQRIFDEEEMWIILQAIHKRRLISFEYSRSYRLGERKHKEWVAYKGIVPLRIMTEDVYGRRSLLGISHDYVKDIRVFRLDRMRHLTYDGYLAEDERYQEEYERYIRHSWCFVGSRISKSLIRVELIFHFGAHDRDRVLGRLQHEGKNGICESIDEHTCRYVVDVNDAREMKPWIRSFTGIVEVAASEQHQLREELQAEQKELAAYYESIQSV